MVTAQTAGPLGPFQWKNRPLLVFVSGADHSSYREQIRRVEADRTGFGEREMVLIEVFGDGTGRAAGQGLSAVDVDALRMEFGVGEDEFAAVLVGKDGTERERWKEPVEMEKVFRLIDGMSMRQREMREGEDA